MPVLGLNLTQVELESMQDVKVKTETSARYVQAILKAVFSVEQRKFCK